MTADCEAKYAGTGRWHRATRGKKRTDGRINVIFQGYEADGPQITSSQNVRPLRSVPQHTGAARASPLQIRLNGQLMKAKGSELGRLVKNHLQDFNLVNCTTALGRSAKMQQDPKRELVEKTAKLIGEVAVQPRQLSSALWACAKMKVAKSGMETALFKALQKDQTLHLRFKPQELSNTLWALGKLGVHCSEEALLPLLAEAAKQIDGFTPQGLSNTAWALASLSLCPTVLVPALLHQAAVNMHRFNAQELSNTMWAFAKMHPPDCHELTQAVATALPRLRGPLTPRHVANTAWALAKIQQDGQDVGFKKLFEARIREQASSFNAQELCMVMWALAKQRVVDPMAQVEEAALQFVVSFSPQQLATTAWAFATLRLPAQNLFSKLIPAVRGRIQELSPQDVSSLAWSLARAEVHEAEAKSLMKDLAGRALKLLQTQAAQFLPKHLANLVWAYALMGVQSPELTRAVSLAACERVCEFNPRDIATMAWGLATLGVASQGSAEAKMLKSPHPT